MAEEENNAPQEEKQDAEVTETEEVAAETAEDSSTPEPTPADDAEEAADNAPEPEPELEPEPVPTGPIRRWYSLRVISGKERKIKDRIELEISRNNWEDYVTQVLVPTEKVYKIRGGKKVISERNILPGYILVEAVPKKLTANVVSTIAGIPNVIHFLGKENPIPMRDAEANRMLGKVDESQDAGEQMIEPFIVGETVKIIDGPFSEFVGDIQEVNEEKKKLKVIVKIFGRGTEVELNFMQVEKTS
jgi:transcription termination/antitermination protein NusG